MAPLEREWDVSPEWIDYNGHLSEAYYVLVFGFATDNLMAHAGYELGGPVSLYTVEAHIRYLREVSLGSRLRVVTSVLSVEARKVRINHEMHVGDETVATEEILAVNVADGRAAVFSDPIGDRLRLLARTAPQPEEK